MELSIILTVYNKEPYLRRVFDSLLSQENTMSDDYEILAVNDGSKDGSASIIEEFVQKDKRVRALTQDNQGLSMARNNGVGAALGDYVWFVDADDVVSPNSVNSICQAIRLQPDAIAIYAKEDDKENIRNQIPTSVRSGNDVLLSRKWEQCGVFWVLKRDFIQKNKLSFLPGIYHEDAEFTPRMLFAAKSICVVPDVLYHVLHEPNSITFSPRPKRAYDCLTVADSLNKFVIDNNLRNTPVGKVLDYHISVSINTALYVIAENSKEEQKRFCESFYSQHHLLRPLKESGLLKYRVEALLLRIFPHNPIKVYTLLKSL